MVKGTVDLDELHKANYRLSQSLTDVEDEPDLINESISTREISQGTNSDSEYSTTSDSSVGTTLTEYSGITKFLLHLQLLLHKTLLMFMRNRTVVLIQMLCPIVWILCLLYFDSREHVLKEMRPIEASRYDLEPIHKCYGPGCVTIGYSIIGDASKQEEYSWIDDIMKSVAETNDLEYREDVKKMTVGSTHNFFQYIEVNPNTTLYSIVWCVDEWVVESNGKEIVLPCTFSEKATNEG